MTAQNYLWLLFALIIVGFLVLDLGYFNRKAHKISTRAAFIQTLFWITTALIFGGLIFTFLGPQMATEFVSAYLVEEMLSVDNLFVFMLIFSFFNLEEEYHHRVLFWGILGAIFFRAIFITLGAVIISQFYWVLYIFGAVLLYTGVKLFKDKKEEHVDFRHNKIFRLASRFLRFSANHHNGKFMVHENGKWHFTTLFMVLILIETTDIIFAFDSIPATFSISQNPFVVYTSNIFAIMGLRAIFFLVEHLLHRFHHLQKGLSFILIFIGLKMLAGIVGVHISSVTSLMVILVALGASLWLSVLFPKKI